MEAEDVTVEQVDLMQQEILGLLATTVDEQPLRDIAQAMELQLEGLDGRKALYRLVANYINSDPFENLDINERFAYLTAARVTILTHIAEQEQRLQDEEARRGAAAAGAAVVKEEEDEDSEEDVRDNDDGRQKKPVDIKGKKVERVVHRLKELKLRGKIGLPGEKKKMTITSLVFQVNSAKTRGYPDADIVDAIINAIDDGVPVKEVFEMMEMEDLTLEFVMTTLKDQYIELDSTTVYHDLCNAEQEKDELVTTFMWRLRVMRDKVLKLSQKEGGGYTKELLQSQFQKSFYSGIQNQAIRVQLKYLAKSKHVSDAKLIKDVNDILLAEKAREEKQQFSKKKAAVNMLSTLSDDDRDEKQKKNPQNQQQKQKENPVVLELQKKLKTQGESMGNMRQEIDQLKAEMQGGCMFSDYVPETSIEEKVLHPAVNAVGYNCEISAEGMGASYPYQSGRGRGRGFRG